MRVCQVQFMSQIGALKAKVVVRMTLASSSFSDLELVISIEVSLAIRD